MRTFALFAIFIQNFIMLIINNVVVMVFASMSPTLNAHNVFRVTQTFTHTHFISNFGIGRTEEILLVKESIQRLIE